jgi:uncharacterized protein
MIRVVLDTNVIVSALLQPLGPPAQILVLALSKSIQMYVSDPVFAEYEEVIGRPKLKRNDTTIAATLKGMRECGMWVTPTEAVRACADLDDDIFVECALAANAAYLVTGNLKHFPSSWRGVQVVGPRTALDIFLQDRA